MAHDALRQIVGQLQKELQYEQELGVPDLPMSKKMNQPANISTSSPLPQSPRTAEGGTLDDIRADIGDCTRCKLCEGRTNIVFGVGNPHADILFIGEGPGRDEDEQGEPFVGRAGKLLTRIIEAMGIERKDVYIANIVKCRPPDNRNPEADEMSTCSPFLYRQIAAIQPKVLIGLGNIAIQTLLQTKTGITRLRGQFHEVAGIPLMPTFHPAFLLRNANKKKEVWEDIQKVMKKLGMKIPKKK